MDVFSIQKSNAASLPLVFDSPHSGAVYPEDFHYACAPDILEAAEDKYVDDLFACAPHYGGSLLLAHFPRSYIDVNRAADDIDAALLEGDWGHEFPIAPSPRSDAGIGLIRRLVKPGLPVYDRHLSAEEILRRVEGYYHPYHAALRGLIEDAHYNFGQVWHIDCHSMPAASAYPRRGAHMAGNRVLPSDFVLGDRDGTSCSTYFTRDLHDFIKGMGYSVSINDPFKGVELVERYSNPARGFHSLQIEINKALYLESDERTKSGNYEALKSDIESIVRFTSDFVQGQLTALAAD